MNNSVHWYSANCSNCTKIAWLNAGPKKGLTPEEGKQLTGSEPNMQANIGAMILAAGLGLASVSNAVAAPVGVDVRGAGFSEGLLKQVQYGRGYCERLRRACIYKEERGEVGEGNCRRYRQECGGRASYCERLRRACVYKEERGEVGEGNCRRYRNECGGYGR